MTSAEQQRRGKRPDLEAMQRRVDAQITAADGAPLTFRTPRDVALFVEGWPPETREWDLFAAESLLLGGVFFDPDTCRAVERLLAKKRVPGVFLLADGWVFVHELNVTPLAQGGAA